MNSTSYLDVSEFVNHLEASGQDSMAFGVDESDLDFEVHDLAEIGLDYD